ncbi:MAG: RDD family protein [Flavobacterium sp.]|nr:MAG: RDD family protein [Flavobacterium sp.]
MNNPVYILEKKLLASDRDRFFNCVIDFVFILFLIFIVSLLIGIIGMIFQWDIFRMWEETIIDLGGVVTYFSFSMLYYLVFEVFFGRTIGKFITGSIVVNENGLKPGFGIICLRTLYRLIPFDPLSFLTMSGRIWHDSFSKTYVVEKKDLKNDMELFYELNLIGKKEVNE